MPDLQDIIVDSSIKAFNQGLIAGKNATISEIMTIIEKISCSNEIGEYVYLRDLIEHLEEAGIA
jgi:hypothetical protein